MIDSLIEALQVNLQLEQEPQSLLRYASEIPRMGPTETVMLFDGLAEFAIANREAKWPRAMAVLLCNISDERVSDWLPDEALPNV